MSLPLFIQLKMVTALPDEVEQNTLLATCMARYTSLMVAGSF